MKRALTPTLSVLRAAYRGFREHGGATMAAASSLYALISLAPLVLLAIVVLGQILGEERARASISEFIRTNIPGPSQLLLQTLHSITVPGRRWFVYLTGLFALLWAGTNFPAQLSLFLNIIWTGKPGRTYLGRRLIAILVTGLAGALFLVSTLLAGFIEAVTSRPERFGAFSPAVGELGEFLGGLISLLFMVAMLILLYRFLPAAPVSWRAALVGALPGTLFLHLLRLLFIKLVVHSGRYGEVYGPLAGATILLLWLYYSALIFFGCAEIAAAYQSKRPKGVSA